MSHYTVDDNPLLTEQEKRDLQRERERKQAQHMNWSAYRYSTTNPRTVQAQIWRAEAYYEA